MLIHTLLDFSLVLGLIKMSFIHILRNKVQTLLKFRFNKDFIGT